MPLDDNIYHPKHYTHGKIEPIDVIEDWKLGFFDGAAVKYICRWKHKNGIEDLEKAVTLLSRLIKTETAKMIEQVNDTNGSATLTKESHMGI